MKPVVDLIKQEAGSCAGDGFNFESKIVFSIAIRLGAEQFMVAKITDAAFVAATKANQSQTLLAEFMRTFSGESAAIKIL